MINYGKFFQFKTSVSLDTYQSKAEATACLSSAGAKAVGKDKMSFKVLSVDVDGFLGLATSGHTFCNLFRYDPNKKYWVTNSKGEKYYAYPEYRKGNNMGGMKLCMKSDQFFAGTQTVFVDIDFTRYTDIGDYLSTLTYQPTCVYMSFSDNKDKRGITSRRFRMVYVFDKILSKEEFYHVSQSINDMIVLNTAEPMEDDCGTRMSQYMNGVYGNNETYVSYCIYSVDDFPKEAMVSELNTPDNTQQQGIVFDEKMLDEMGNFPTDKFLHFYSWKYPYQYRTEKPYWEDDDYQLTDENYLQLWWYREKQQDGQRRRRKLFKNACLRRLMFPEMSPDAALYNLYLDFVRFFDNSDHAITLDCLVRKVRHAFTMTYEQLVAFCEFEIRYWRENRPQFIIRHGCVCNQGVIAKIKKRIRWADIASRYNPSISLQENIQNGIGVPLATLYRYCKENGIDPNPNRSMTEAERRLSRREEKQRMISQFRSMYNPSISVSENQRIMSFYGLELSTGTICNWAHKYCQEQPQIDICPIAAEIPVNYSYPSYSANCSMPEYQNNQNNASVFEKMQFPPISVSIPEFKEYLPRTREELMHDSTSGYGEDTPITLEYKIPEFKEYLPRTREEIESSDECKKEYQLDPYFLTGTYKGM